MIKITANRDTRINLRRLCRPYKRVQERALHNALMDIGSDVTELIAKYILGPPKTGRIYIINGRPHQASAPFESPAELTGRLRRSINFSARGGRQLTIGESAPYAAALEMGTRDNRILPRPHIIRAIKARHRSTRKTLIEYLNKAHGIKD